MLLISYNQLLDPKFDVFATCWMASLLLDASVRIPMTSVVATRWSFLSSVKEESRIYQNDSLKACGCASVSPYTAQNNVYVELKDPKVC